MQTTTYQLVDALLAWFMLVIICLVLYALIWAGIKRFILVPYMKKRLHNETTPDH